jgi:hypothetical protein
MIDCLWRLARPGRPSPLRSSVVECPWHPAVAAGRWSSRSAFLETGPGPGRGVFPGIVDRAVCLGTAVVLGRAACLGPADVPGRAACQGLSDVKGWAACPVAADVPGRAACLETAVEVGQLC